MNTTPKPKRSFFSIAAWYAVVAPLAAAAIFGVAWLIWISPQGSLSSLGVALGTAEIVLITSIVASIVSLFGIRRHGWRVIVWKSLAGFALSLLVFAAPGFYFTHHVLVIHEVPAQNQVARHVDTLDLDTAANAAVQSLLESGVLDRAPHHPAMLEIGNFINNTTQQLDLTLLASQISAPLLRSGKAVVVEKRQNAADRASGSVVLSHPDFTLSGMVMESRERTGGISQTAYVFSFSLTDSNGLAVWMEEKTIERRRNLSDEIMRKVFFEKTNKPHVTIRAPDEGRH